MLQPACIPKIFPLTEYITSVATPSIHIGIERFELTTVLSNPTSIRTLTPSCTKLIEFTGDVIVAEKLEAVITYPGFGESVKVVADILPPVATASFTSVTVKLSNAICLIFGI